MNIYIWIYTYINVYIYIYEYIFIYLYMDDNRTMYVHILKPHFNETNSLSAFVYWAPNNIKK